MCTITLTLVSEIECENISIRHTRTHFLIVQYNTENIKKIKERKNCSDILLIKCYQTNIQSKIEKMNDDISK